MFSCTMEGNAIRKQTDRKQASDYTGREGTP